MRPTLLAHETPMCLFHITPKSRLSGIREKGILPSAYGDLPVGENDGRGVYAVMVPKDAASIAAELEEEGETAYAVCFFFLGLDAPWYECIGEIAEDEEDDTEKDHIGYVVIPDKAIPPEDILFIKPYRELN